MLDRISRVCVESVKNARRIALRITGEREEELTIVFDNRKHDIRKLSHDLALAVQDYFNKCEHQFIK